MLRREELDAVYTLNYVGLLSELLHHLRMIGLWEELAALLPEKKQRWIIPMVRLLLIYLQRHIARLSSVNAAKQEVALMDETAMRMVGFNAHQIADGICRRGRHRRRAATPPGRPVCADTVAR